MALRRELHAHRSAVVADVRGERPGPTWALGFDTDALPIQESHELTDNPAPHHHPAFDVDERAVTQSVDLLEALVREES